MTNVSTILFGIGVFLLLFSCKNDDDISSSLDVELEGLLISQSQSQGQGLNYFKLPSSDDFNNIPQDPGNLLNVEKVLLGQLLYHETGLGLSPKIDIGKQTYSCASCHFAAAGFQSGRFQAIAEGGIGFGIRGEARDVHPDYPFDSLDCTTAAYSHGNERRLPGGDVMEWPVWCTGD